jgi:tetratricopeptide (TPR) repeat protein/transcriptional regulator with XRE-family HTH domain
MAGQPQFRDELRRRRQIKGVSLHQLSQLTHYSKGHLGNIENGVKPPTIELAGACDEALDAGGALTALVEPPPDGRSRRPPTPRPTQVRPRQLPADIVDFTGRTDQVDEIVQLLTPGGSGGSAICAVVGCGGVGKTALAVRAAHLLAGGFPDGQLYANLHGYGPGRPRPPGLLLERFVRALGVPAGEVPADPDEQAALYRSLLDGRRVLIVLDNAAGAEQVRPLLPGGSDCRVLVTSRDRLAQLVALDGARRLDVDVLPRADAIALLTRIVGAGRLGPPRHAEELVELCARLPLAVRIAAASIVDRPGRTVGDHLARLRSGGPLDGLALDGDEHATVRANLDLSYDRLDAAGQRLFRRLGLVPGPDFTAAAAAALGEPDQLDRLAAVSLVERQPGERYQFHDLLRAYAADRARRDEPDATAIRAELLGWYLRSTQAAARLLYPGKVRLPDQPVELGGFDSHETALAWLDAERANLVAAAESAAATGPHELAWQLADALRGYFWTRRCTAEWLAVASAAVAAADRAGEPLGRAAAELNLADAYWSQGDYPPALAHYAVAHESAGRAGWVDGEAAACTNRGNVRQELGEFAAAAADYRRALDLYEQSGQPSRQAAALANLGALHHQAGRLERAAEHYARALHLHRANDDQAGQALTLNIMGLVQLDLGRLDLALTGLTQAARLSAEIGDRYGQARAAENLARTHCAAGRYAEALAEAETALDLARETGDRNGEAQTLVIWSAVVDGLGRYEQALSGYRQATRLARELNLPSAEGEALIGTGRTRLHLGEPAEARRLAAEALTLTRGIGYRVLEGQALSLLADADLADGRAGPARTWADEALAAHRQTGHRLGTAGTLETLARLYDLAGDEAAAAAVRREARELFE